ncbi:C40 family peptidase [Streptomyces litchfieldiae]|uniref:NlpC/P60 family protein n=1 Tax=Streptomyces litchfieldiae TaxID=3075543 RepID=A0ABU2MJ24_9ACTN|nr:NlpC/P60 family protein [Streptomyces sp. DSM 44938]MDT0341598.1 NlpC/P60 family protein [Streptomyces sp. DSM 44938]
MTRATLTCAVAALALVAVPAPPAAAEPDAEPGRGTGALLAELRTLHRETGAANEAYNETAQRLRAQREETAELTKRLAATRTELADARDLAGAVARAQYRGGGVSLPPALRLLTGQDPDRALHDQTVARRAARAQVAEIERLARGEREADDLAAAARKALDAEQTLAEEQRRRRDEVHRRLDEVAALLAGLSPAEAAELDAPEEERAASAAPRGTADDGEPPRTADDGEPPSPAGARAADWARGQVGKPYAWGADGPDAFDAAGLTAAAWDHAGRTIPRSSTGQWEELPRVPLDALRPGDVVLYFDDATHVGLYAGDGQVVHAPHPGAEVTLAPLDVHPPLGAVRPA